MTVLQKTVYLLVANLIFCVKSSPVDFVTTSETRQLLHILHSLSKDSQRFLFGQHKATMTGCEGGHIPYSIHKQKNHTSWTFTETQVNTHSNDELCDLKGLTGEYPAVLSFDLGDLNSHSLAIQRYLIKKAAEKGLIVTVSWHMRNPINNGSPLITDDHTHTNLSYNIRRLLDGGDFHTKFKQVLNQAADFFLSLLDSDGNLIPVLFMKWMDNGFGGVKNNEPRTHLKITNVFSV